MKPIAKLILSSIKITLFFEKILKKRYTKLIDVERNYVDACRHLFYSILENYDHKNAPIQDEVKIGNVITGINDVILYTKFLRKFNE
mmetsp:Transcript_79421/g.97163  ORF Transcript_79421/g.97163 Transcript_79421/m.97163 type:complete len:87 (+) Transcript_79421:1-261(+)